MRESPFHGSWPGYASLFVGVGLFSTIEIASKALSERAAVDPFLLVFLRFSVTAVVLLALSVRLWRPRVARFGLRDWGLFCLNGVVGITLSISFFQLAILAFHNAASSAVVFSANPVFVTIFSRFVNGEAWTVRKWLSMALGCVGVSAFAWESGDPTSESVLGMVLMLSAAMFFALSICISRRYVAEYGAVPFMGFSSVFGSLLVLPIALWHMGPGTGEALVKGWLLIAYIAVVGTALAYAAYYYGLSRTSAYRASMSFFLKPVLASVLCVVLLGEKLNAWTLTGTALILSGLVLSVRIPRLRLRSSATGELPEGDAS